MEIYVLFLIENCDIISYLMSSLTLNPIALRKAKTLWRYTFFYACFGSLHTSGIQIAQATVYIWKFVAQFRVEMKLLFAALSLKLVLNGTMKSNSPKWPTASR